MTTDIMQLLVAIIFASGIMTLIGLRMRYTHMQGIQVSGGAQQEGGHLADAVDHLRADFELMRGELLELNERVDFTERLLEQPKTEA